MRRQPPSSTPVQKADRDPFERLPDYFRVIPRQIPLYWIEGRFNVTQYRSDRYNALGWSLLMRGLYWYEVVGSGNKFKHAGIAKIDFEPNSEDLRIQGVRLLGDRLGSEVLVWQSMLCKLVVKPAHAELRFAYLWKSLSDKLETAAIGEIKGYSATASKAAKRNGFKGQRSTFDCLSDQEQEGSIVWIQENFDDVFESLETVPTYALVICNTIKEPPTVSSRFEFEGRFLPTFGESDEEQITFLRIA